jgi:hypothetical protein
MASSLTPLQLRAAALSQRYGIPTPTPKPAALAAVHNRVWVAARAITTRYNSQLFVYTLIENEVYGSKGFPHTVRLPQNSTVAGEFEQAINFGLRGLPRNQRTALHTDIPVLPDLSDFEDLTINTCAKNDNRASAYLEGFIRDSNPYR